MLVVQCSWEEMKRSDTSFVSPIAWPSKTRERSSKMTDFFKKKQRTFLQKWRTFFLHLQRGRKKKSKEWRVEKEWKKKNLIRYFANHKEIITFAAYIVIITALLALIDKHSGLTSQLWVDKIAVDMLRRWTRSVKRWRPCISLFRLASFASPSNA